MDARDAQANSGVEPGDGSGDVSGVFAQGAWRLPVLVVSTALIVVGVMRMGKQAPGHDFDGVFDEAAAHLQQGRMEQAERLLRMVAQPHIEEATPAQRARYHALVADWAFAVGAVNGSSAPAMKEVDVRYARAVELGMALQPQRTARWALALIESGELEIARVKLMELDALDAATEGGPQLRAARNRVFQALIEAQLARGAMAHDESLELLDAFRADARLAPADRVWAMTSQARVRLDAGWARAALDHLLIDMRRVEQPQPETGADAARRMTSGVGEMYLLMARAQRELGLDDEARYNADQALQRLPATAAVRGEALVLRGELALEEPQGGDERALALFDEAAEQYVGTRAQVPAIFGRAIVRSRLGDHDGALRDIDVLADKLRSAPERSDVTALRVSERLIDRHDAALITGQLELAARYAQAAEGLFARAEVPAQVLRRIAATTSQIADNMPVDTPAVRAEAAQQYTRAGEYFLAHARALVSDPEQSEAWAQSLRLAGERFDMGGRPDQAIACFEDYLAGRPADDPQRSDVSFRLAQAQHAEMNYEAAAATYEQVITEHPLSPDATASHVPLAQCLAALGREQEAMQHLREVVEGRYALTPAAGDYRDVLVELGRIEYDLGLYVPAIETLREVTDRYADDERAGATLFRLADSYRGWAGDLAREMEEDVALSPVQRDQHAAQARLALEQAAATYDRALEVLRGAGQEPEDSDDAMIRAAMMRRGDCAYGLGRFREAIVKYDAVARAYKTRHESLTALIQVVNCHARLNETSAMQMAHERAQHRLRELPDEAFAEPGALLDREAWSRWLRNRPPGDSGTAVAGANTDEG